MKITLNLAVRHLCVMLSVLFLFACSEKKPAKVTVNVKNGNDEQIIVSKPIRDQYFYFNQDTIRLGKDTVAVCQIEIDKIGIAQIFVGDQECKLILQPGDDLEVTFDASNPKGDLLFAGTNAAGQMHYNGISRLWDMYAYEFKRDFTVAPLDTVGERMFQNFQNLSDRDKAIFLKLKDDNLIDPTFQEFAEQDVQCFYMAQLSRVLGGTYGNYYFNNGPLYKNGEALIDLICQTCPITENTPRYSEGSEYIDNYLKLMSVVSLNEGGLNVDDLFMDKTLYANAIRYFQKPDLQEYALALITLGQGRNNKMFSDEVVTTFADFNTRFPESSYTPFLKPYVDLVTDFRTKIKQDFSPEMVFVEGYSDITNLKDLLSRFKGQNLFIDFWFANCGPCREQFKYNEGLKKFLAENNIEMLYVSVDRDEYDSHWKDCIKYYDLKGKHVRTTRELHTDLYNNYGIYDFPTYMVVGQNGDILVPRAKRPETGEALYNQIKDALNLTK